MLANKTYALLLLRVLLMWSMERKNDPLFILKFQEYFTRECGPWKKCLIFKRNTMLVEFQATLMVAFLLFLKVVVLFNYFRFTLLNSFWQRNIQLKNKSAVNC